MKLSLALLLMAISCATAWAQGTAATLSGTVTDPSGAIVHNAQVIAQNMATGVQSRTVSNTSGVYVFPALQPGQYQVTAELTGFRKMLFNDISLDVAARVTLDIAMQVGQTNDSILVTGDGAAQVGYLTSSVGAVINDRKVLELPLAGRNVYDLLSTQAGVSGANGGQNFNGARVGSLNITLDGTVATDNLLNSLFLAQVSSGISVDRVEEFRIVTSPADAELGRGSGQVQAITRSGGNKFHGAAFNEHRDRSLTANNFFNNQRGQARDLLIRNFFGARLGGPIRKNKTFFHLYYEQRIERASATVTSSVLTAAARQGIWRFFPGARNGNALAGVPTVDLAGNPVRPGTATGDLQSVNVFGLDPNRLRPDPSGIIAKQLSLMPLPNDFRFGDGLNTAGYTWNRPRPSDFHQYDIRVDHQFGLLGTTNRASIVYSRQSSESTNFIAAQRYPSVPGGGTPNETTTVTFTLSTTLRPTLLNEFRSSGFRPRQTYTAPWELAGTGILPSVNGQPFLLSWGSVNSPLFPGVGDDPSTRISPVYQTGDSVTWIKGKHQVKGGFEVRFVSTAGFDTFNVLPRISLGAGPTPVQNIITIPGIGQNTGAVTLLTDLSGSVGSVVQNFNASTGSNPAFLPGLTRYQHLRQPELSWFLKDDFKVTPKLTLNLGVRYELYMVPTENTGRGVALDGGSGSLFGISGNSFDALFKPGNTPGALTKLIPIGPKTANPDARYSRGDLNNFAPAVGLSWQLPGFDAKPLVLRMGYGIGYERNPLFLTSSTNGGQPGLSTLVTFNPSASLDLSRATLPLQAAGKPLTVVPLTDRISPVSAIDSNLRTAYYQNWNVSISKSLTKNTTFEARYVGNKGSKLVQLTNVNEVNIFENGLLDAFVTTQTGGNAPLFDRIFAGLTIPGLGGVVDGVRIRGSDLVRNPNSGLQGVLTTNNVGSLAAFLETTNQLTGVNGGLIKRAGLPENFILANPQFGNANFVSNLGNSTYHALQLELNKRFSSGYTLQANYTFSKALGNYDGDDSALGSNFRTLRNTSLDKQRLGFDRTHVWRANGLWELPFGPGKSIGRNSRGILGKVIGGWQTGTIFTVSTGAPLSVNATSAFNTFGLNTAVAATDIGRDLGSVQRTGSGVIYFDGLKQVVDPYVARITTINAIQSRSTLLSVADASGKLLFVNPAPGQLGMAPRFLNGPGNFRLDINLLKAISITERVRMTLRADAVGITNTPQFGNPDTNINSLNFGRITSSTGSRVVVLTGRIDF